MPDLSSMLTWWQWLILAAVPPAIVALYFLKLKRRPLEVPSTYLWHKSIEDLHVNAIWQRLRRNLLLLLQLLLILLVALALLRPTWQAPKLTGKRFVFLIDNSASMQATDVKTSRLEEAKRKTADLIDEMRSGDVAMIISFSDGARVEQTFTDNRRRLREALEAIQPTQRATAIVEALKVASGLVNPSQTRENTTDVEVTDTKLYIMSDGRFPPVTGFELGNLDPIFVPIGNTEAANVGIVAMNLGRQEGKADRLQAFARLENFGPQAATVSLQLYLDNQLINADRVEIPGKEARGVAFDVGAAEAGVLRLKASATAGDDLPVDDEAWTVIAPPRRAQVLIVTPGNYPIERAIATKEVAKRADIRMESPDFLKSKPYQEQSAAGLLDLVIYDRCRPERMPRANTLFIGSLPPEDSGWAAKPKVDVPQIIDTQVSHPLMQWLDLGNVELVEATPLRVPPGGATLVDSDAGPLVAVAPREGFEDAVLGFALVDEAPGAAGKAGQQLRTNWAIRDSFTYFVLNVLGYLGGTQNALEFASVRPGSPIALDGPDPQATVTVRTPGGETVPLRAGPQGKFNFTGTEELGIYGAQSGGKTFQRFAVNLLNPAESSIPVGKAPQIQIGHVPVVGQSGWQPGHREIWKGFVLLGLAVSLAEWYIYNRRVYL